MNNFFFGRWYTWCVTVNCKLINHNPKNKIGNIYLWFFIRFSTVRIFHVNMATSEGGRLGLGGGSAYPYLGQSLWLAGHVFFSLFLLFSVFRIFLSFLSTFLSFSLLRVVVTDLTWWHFLSALYSWFERRVFFTFFYRYFLSSLLRVAIIGGCLHPWNLLNFCQISLKFFFLGKIYLKSN